MIKQISPIILLALLIFLGGFGMNFAQAQHHTEEEHAEQTHHVDSHDDASHHAEGDHHHGKSAAPWSVIPFALLLLMIATGPLFYEHFWHKSYPIIAISIGILVILYYLFVLGNTHAPIHSLAEYIQFIALLSGLYVASGGILINVDKKSKPLTNVILLALGAVLSNIIGTIGASMLLIRPFIRLNKNKIKPYHIIFFIFIVSNIGGSLTPIGDPPLFLGFLKGVPFTWTITHNFLPWLVAICILLIVFYVFDSRNKTNYAALMDEEEEIPTNKITLVGTKNFLWLAVVIGAVFLDPNVFDWVPGINAMGQKFSFIREIIMLATAFFSFKFASKDAIKGNDFTFEPIREVAFIFIGIFFSMMPALELVGEFAKSPEGAALISPSNLYWGTGILSGFLDNAPTYVNFLTAALASAGADIANSENVIAYANNGFNNSTINLMAISIGAVFFGAFTYIGNGPNFMVKSIAEQVGIKMPSFFLYIFKYSIPVLLPILVIIWLIFFL